ncbi:MAG: glycosyl transferase [Muribaculaceae bacterium]|nr:glycosyl transferase [Muribaculaceae bacterium]
MIPKVIHYCWFGRSPLGKLGERCLASWQKFFPDYEIKEWNEDNFDVNCIPYVAEAYQAKKYAFVSDYARMWILYQYGGVYFDTDVEVIKPFEDIIMAGGFMGCENRPSDIEPLYVAPGLGMACEPRHPLIGEFMEYYHDLHFLDNNQPNLTTVVVHITSLLQAKGLKPIESIQDIMGIKIYPKEYFCPIDTKGQVMEITDNTRSIHHYAGTWSSWDKRFKKKIARLLGPKIALSIISIKQFFRSLIPHHNE